MKVLNLWTNTVTLKNTTLRGLIFLKNPVVLRSIKEYQNKEFEMLKGPRLLVLDSEGDIHYFRYYDANYFAPTVSMFTHHLTIEGLTEKQRRLKSRLNQAKKYRDKSLSQRIVTAQKKNRSKSQLRMESTPAKLKISYKIDSSFKCFVYF